MYGLLITHDRAIRLWLTNLSTLHVWTHPIYGGSLVWNSFLATHDIFSGATATGKPSLQDYSLAKGERDGTDVTSEDGNRSLLCQILRLAFPALISLCVDPFMSVVDTVYIGQLDPDLGGGKVS